MPSWPAARMQPCMAGRFDAVGQQRVMTMIIPPQPRKRPGIELTVLRFSHSTTQQANAHCSACERESPPSNSAIPARSECLPVLGRPAIAATLQHRHNGRLSKVEGGGADASRTRSLPSTLRLEACGAGSLESCDCAHMRVLQAGRSLVPLTKMPFSPGAPAKTSPSFPTFPTLPSSARPPRGMSGFWGMSLQGFSADA
jgi:hypothetical protein